MSNDPFEIQNYSFNAEHSNVPPQQDENSLVHSKVSFGPCFSETFIFFRRYFGRRLFWMFLLAVSLGFPYSLYLFYNSAMGLKSTGEISSSFNEQIPEFMAGPIFWAAVILAFCGGIFHLMILNWGIKTVQTGDDSWGNLKIQGLVKKIVKIFLSNICFSLCIFGLILAVSIPLGIIAMLARNGGIYQNNMFLIPYAVLVFWAILFILYRIIRYSFFVSFILDRNVGPLQAINFSSRMMKQNVWTFLGGILCLNAIIICVALPIVIISGIGIAALKNAGSSSILNIMLLNFLPQTFINLIGVPLIMGFMIVFYLMITGQKRPGVWPKNAEEQEEKLN